MTVDDLENVAESTRAVRDYVLVHGGWGGRWCWDGVARRLEAVGDRVHVPTMTGLGERADEVTSEVGMATHVEDVMRVILDHDLSEVELVGHSYGGMPVTGAAYRLPERVAHVVYLDALSPFQPGQAGSGCSGVASPG